MKIIGGHDYYDKAMQFGVDESVVLVRDDRPLAYSEPIAHCFTPRRGRYNYMLKEITIVVGDTLYRGLSYSDTLKNHTVWTSDALENILVERGENHEKRYMTRYTPHRRSIDCDPDVYFEPSKISDQMRDFMLTERLSIMIGDTIGLSEHDWWRGKANWFGNPPRLKEYDFYKVIDPFTIYQTLDMWVSGVLTGSGNGTVEITDNNVKIQKHGFDTKTSFRKEKSK